MKRWRRYKSKVRRALRGAKLGWGDKPVISLFRLSMFDSPQDLQVFRVQVAVSRQALKEAESNEEYAEYLAGAIRDQCLLFFGRARVPNV